MNTRRRVFSLLIAAQLLAGLLKAQTQTEMNRDAYLRMVKADDEMREVYRSYLRLLDESGKAKLNASQAAWEAFRDKEATLEADVGNGGTITAGLDSAAREALIEARTRQLRELLSTEEKLNQLRNGSISDSPSHSNR